METCAIDFNVDDKKNSLVAFVKRLHGLMTDASLHAWTLDLGKCKYLGPDAASIILSLVLEAKRRRQAWRVDLPTQPPALAGFCEFSGLKHWLQEAPEPNEVHPQNETIPLRVVQRANFRDAAPIVSLVRRHTGIGHESAEYLRTCVNEVTQNIEDHAQSSVGGVMCARYLVNQHEVRVAIVDRGVGIADSLRTRIHDITDGPSALRKVVVGGFSAQSRINNAGLGISYLWGSVKRLNGHMLIMSQDGIAELRRTGGQAFERLNPPFPGTGVFFTLPVDAEKSKSDPDDQ